MEKTKIDWCDSTWNPVSGCLHGCEYCYARRIAERFGGLAPDNKNHVLDEINRDVHEKADPYPFGFAPTFHRYRLDEYINKKGKNIFVCSMADLFGKWVPDDWIEEVFAACEKAPQHNYLFLTKNPKRYLELCSIGKIHKDDNFWYGQSITKEGDRIVDFQHMGLRWFLSIEPLLSPLRLKEKPDWVIIGAETGRRKEKVIPERKWIEDIVNDCRDSGIPVFMKSNIADIWGEPLIQEFPF